MYAEFDDRQTAMLEDYLAAADVTLDGRAHAIADAYVGCTLAQGRELTGVLAALEGSPELEQVKREAELAYADRCRRILDPFTGPAGLSAASLTAIFGAAEALSHAAVIATLSAEQASAELARLIVVVVGR